MYIGEFIFRGQKGDIQLPCMIQVRVAMIFATWLQVHVHCPLQINTRDRLWLLSYNESHAQALGGMEPYETHAWWWNLTHEAYVPNMYSNVLQCRNETDNT